MRKINKNQKLIILIAIIMVLVIIGVIVGANAIKINIASGRYNSANNNSSSGNLLPEYIKEGITLGGVTGSLVDLDTSDATATAMDIAYGKTAYVDGKKIEGAYVSRNSLQVGDYISYIPDTAEIYVLSSEVSGYSSNQNIEQEDFTWQILNINDDGTVDIISSTPTNHDIYFNGSLGYNNGVYVLNDICSKHYSNKELGVSARNINLSDIESNMNETGIQTRNEYISDGNIQYEKANTYKNNKYYPLLYAQENGSGIDTTTIKNDGISRDDKYYNSPTKDEYAQAGSNGLTVTQNFYDMLNNMEEFFNNINFYDLALKTNDVFWISSRFSDCKSDYVRFGLWFANDMGQIKGHGLYHSTNVMYESYAGIRPVCSLGTEIIIYGGDGSEEHPYQLTK